MNDEIPVMPAGRYVGKRVDTLPASYLRWVISQKFAPEILACAKHKLESSDYNDLYLNVTRHAIDMFSKRFLTKWQRGVEEQFEVYKSMSKTDGLATFVAKCAQEAWEKGLDRSRFRHEDDGVVKEFDGIKWVFQQNKNYPDYKELITIM